MPDNLREIERELVYINTQLKIGQPLHKIIRKSLDKLRKLGYPEEHIEFIEKQFTLPVEQRKPAPPAEVKKPAEVRKPVEAKPEVKVISGEKVTLSQIKREFQEMGIEPTTRRIIRFSEDVIDFLADQTKATDQREMGGFVCGGYYTTPTKVYTLYWDVIPCPNAVEEATQAVSYMPDLSCAQEVKSSPEYDLVTEYHTHPGNSLPSIADIEGELYIEKRRYWVKTNPDLALCIVLTGKPRRMYLFARTEFLVYYMTEGYYSKYKSEKVSEASWIPEDYQRYLREYLPEARDAYATYINFPFP